MSGRKYLSGAQKRKNADKKKQNLENELKKVPKLVELFNVQESSTNRNASTSELETPSNDIIIEENQMQIDENISEITNTPESMAIDNVNDEEQLSEKQVNFSNDVGLWNVPDDLQALQRYWVRLGEFHSSKIKLLL